MLQGKKILLGITGGIAAYKAVDLVSKLKKQGADVKVIMTKSAAEFITPLTLETLSGQPVAMDMFKGYIQHITWADWADLMVVAPATANIIGKTANGIADDLLSTTIMACQAPKFIVPAMNIHMYENPIVQENMQNLKEKGYLFMEPEVGTLACGYEGKGRFPQIQEIIYHIRTYLEYNPDLTGQKILITAGASVEKLDPMRFISNFSSGKMGLALARAAHIRGAQVKLVHSKLEQTPPEYIESIPALTASQMYEQVQQDFPNYNTTFMVAAVSDFTPAKISQQKIKKTENELELKLKRTPDILKTLGEQKQTNQKLIGFAAESENLVQNGQKKLQQKNLDCIVINNLQVSGQDDTSVIILNEKKLEKITGDKFMVANKILDFVYGK
ncbi:MAG TPA: bifunctional phosphopantothenoylcysteine decarboxylase/phosphopantothenate--cysteine ligase CoaBC [Candidatus Cloacimonas sp.]|jgi:phosphopantothenoylcysteine decarboxylase/phosphopantothenate--cysteine ligase|nr:phosphopantothenoylcysteine decarboxylase / phosphopantothenate---cysteine ligase [Candidatus Cloacimonadota bacterium]HCX73133.1 bifunctional phosphopantothenoylcysteine decarboxylase/phosphopantothenate--cysteine ligase CoaBC [Candidatus Cloacimonas sp.]